MSAAACGRRRANVRWYGVYYKGSDNPAALFSSKGNAEEWCAKANDRGEHTPAPGFGGYVVRETRAYGVKALG